MTDNFFEEQAEQSQVKSAIVEKYFTAWARIILGHQGKKIGDGQHKQRINYIDLFAGPGRYGDGTKSTPVLILETAIQNPAIRSSLVSVFNDKDERNVRELQKTIDEIPGIRDLKHKPIIHQHEVDDDVVRSFESMDLDPTLFFFDPWGYKGLSLRLINSVLKNWACECIFFFNYSRINAGLSNDLVRKHMEALFGERAGELKKILEDLDTEQRELTVVEELCQALIRLGGKYVLPFRFTNSKGTRTSHHLIFVSKNPKGYKIMKEVMAKESSATEQGVASFGYNPADRRQRLLFELNRPLDDLEDMLLDEYAGKTMTMEQIFESHNYGRRYISRNYKAVLSKMEIAGKISADPPREKRRPYKGEISFGDDVKVTFPAR